jgi:hypothetical protein
MIVPMRFLCCFAAATLTCNCVAAAEVGAGERMVDRAVVHVYEMLGRLHSEPEEMLKNSSQ